jgi:hypothetical protein
MDYQGIRHRRTEVERQNRSLLKRNQIAQAEKKDWTKELNVYLASYRIVIVWWFNRKEYNTRVIRHMHCKKFLDDFEGGCRTDIDMNLLELPTRAESIDIQHTSNETNTTSYHNS